MRRAITLVEVLVAGVILVLVAIPVLVCMQTSTAQLQQSRAMLVAEQLAQALIETWPVAPERFEKSIVDGSCADLLADADARAVLTAGATEVEELIRAAKFTMKVETETSVGGHAGLARVEARLDWDEGPRRVARTFARLVNR